MVSPLLLFILAADATGENQSMTGTPLALPQLRMNPSSLRLQFVPQDYRVPRVRPAISQLILLHSYLKNLSFCYPPGGFAVSLG